MSHVSNISTLSNRSGVVPPSPRGGSTSSAGGGGSVCSSHVSIDQSSSIDIEQEKRGDGTGISVMKEFSELAQLGNVDEGLMQCLQMYGFEKPKKLQQHAIPAISQSLGRKLGDHHTSAGKSCVVVQGPERSGKTSSMVLSLLAAIDTSVPNTQAILLTSSGKRDFDKYLGVLTLMQPVTYQSFLDVDEELDLNSPEVKAAHNAHILIGHPKKILRLLSGAPKLRLDFVRVVAIDDAEELVYDAQELAPKGPSLLSKVGAENGSESPVPSPSRSKVPESPHQSASRGQAQRKPLVDDVIQIRHVLECRQYSHNHTDTIRIRAGQSARPKLRHIILTQPLVDEASKKVLRLLRNSLMQKKNMVKEALNAAPPTKLIKSMKHYYVSAPKEEWVRILSGLVQTLMFPRALVYCDEAARAKDFLDEMNERKLSVSANLPSGSGSSSPKKSQEKRRQAVQDFVGNKSQFLFTNSEPSVVQLVLPKVSCVFHMDVPTESPSAYGIRLLPLDEKTAKDSVSVLFIEPQEKKTVTDIEKLFDVRFIEMPFDFLPETSSSSKRPPSRGNSRHVTK
jgi:superfamily II DNA/RNA helicase